MANNELQIKQIPGRAIPLPGDNIDTDQITPADSLKETTFNNMASYLFRDAKKKDPNHPLDDARYAGASLLFVGKNFGSGSSRESAAQAIMRFGIRALVGESFAEIFAGNCNVLGVTVVTASHDDVTKLMEVTEQQPQTTFLLDLEAKSLHYQSDGQGVDIAVDLPESRRAALTSGTWNALELLKANEKKIKDVAGQLPYMRNFK